MSTIVTIIKSSIYGVLLGILFIIWGVTNDGVIRIILGSAIILIALKVSINDHQYLKDIESWKARNQNKLVFFYPASKRVQRKIEENIIPLLPNNTLKVFYEGPTLVGDIDRTVLKQLMLDFKQIDVNSPSIFKIKGDSIYLENLEELKNIELNPIDPELIKAKINRIACA